MRNVLNYTHFILLYKVTVMQQEFDLSALSGILRFVASRAPSSPGPPSRSGCTAEEDKVRHILKLLMFHVLSDSLTDLIDLLIINTVQIQISTLRMLICIYKKIDHHQ